MEAKYFKQDIICEDVDGWIFFVCRTEAQYSLLATGDGVLYNIPSLVCGVVLEHGLLDGARESVRRLIEVNSDSLPIGKDTPERADQFSNTLSRKRLKRGWRMANEEG